MSRPRDEVDEPTASIPRSRPREESAEGSGTASTEREKPAIEQPAQRKASLSGLSPATRIDRFLILEKIGEGGMGAVYAAYDTLLDRKVAMKVVRPEREVSTSGLSARERLLREAQAMARLRHPNVVSVLEVGELGDNVYLALELVEGQTLKSWLREKRRPWREVVAAFVEAGRGLDASHAAGLVHRDVKPDNILRGKDGRIQVTDFGVVSMSRVGRDEETPESGGSGGSSPDTLSGLRVGTPAYMAPEQFAGAPVDARADQFSFCVALWEGLFGERPFEPARSGTPFHQRVMREVPRDTDVPGWLVATVRRALAADARARWPSMGALLVELTRRRGIHRRGILGAAIAAVLSISVAVAFAGWTRTNAPTPCQDEGRHLAGVWDDARAGALSASLRATGAPTADAVALRARGHLDAWTGRWVEQRTATCAATRIHGGQSEAMLDVRMRCLDRQLVRVREIVRELGSLDREHVGRALEITANLPDLQGCTDTEQLTAMAPLPEDPVIRGRVEELERELAHAAAVERAGRYPAALAIAAPLLERAAATRYEPIHAEAMAMIGRLRVQTGDHAGGIAALREAAAIAGRGHADDIAASALVELVWATAEAGRGAEAVAVAAAVRPTVVRGHAAHLEALLAAQVGDAQMVAGDLSAATTELSRALVLTESAMGRDHYQLAQVLNDLGAVEERQNRIAEARAYYARSLAILEAQIGSEHPSAAITRANLCYLDSTAGRLDESAQCYVGVIATLEAALGPDHPKVAWALNDAGLVEQARSRWDQARTAWERAVAIYERASGKQHPDIAWPLVNLGGLALRNGEPTRGESLCRRALAVIEETFGPEHAAVFDPLVCVGATLTVRKPTEAVRVLERALRVERAERDPYTLGVAHFALARACAVRGDHRGAATNARHALAAFTEAGTTAASERTDLLAWMARQRIRDVPAHP